MKKFKFLSGIAFALLTIFGCTKTTKQELVGNKVIEIEAKDAATLDAKQSYVVEQTSRYSEYSSGTKQEFEVFTNRKDAETFAKELKNAFELIRHTSKTTVKVYKSSR